MFTYDALFTYDAFLSYSHQDAAVAAGIQKGLHRIGRRVGRLHALRVFRDSTDLSANPNLWGSVVEALDRSRYLIVVLSPRAAASPWVNRELQHWMTARGPEQILMVLAAGELHWDAAHERLDPSRSDAAPPVLTQPHALPAEPLYVDVRGDAPWDPDTGVFRDKLTDLAAPVHGTSKYELASDDVREQRRFHRLRRAAVTALALLTVVAVVAATVAFKERGEALKQRNQAVAGRLSAQAAAILSGLQGGGDVRAVMFSLAATRVAPSVDAGPQFTAVQRLLHVEKILQSPAAMWDVAISPDGTRVVSTGLDNTLQRWDAHTGLPVGPPMTGHHTAVRGVAVSPEGIRILSFDDASTVRLWDSATGDSIGDPITVDGLSGAAFLGESGGIVTASWSGPQLALFDADGRRLPDIDTGEVDGLASVAVSRDGQLIAAGGANGDVSVWNSASHTKVSRSSAVADDQYPLYSIAFSPDGTRVAASGVDPAVRVWDVGSGARVATMTGHTDRVYSVAFSRDGGRIVSAGLDKTIRVWNATTFGAAGHPLTGHTDGVLGAVFTPDGTRIVSASVDATIRIWDADTTRPVDNSLSSEVGPVVATGFNPDASHVIVAGLDGVRRWNIATGRLSAIPLRPPGTNVAISGDGHRILTGPGVDGALQVWDAATGQSIGPPILAGRNGDVRSVAITADGRRIAYSLADGTVDVWDTTTAEHVAISHTGATATMTGAVSPTVVSSLAFSPDGTRIASATDDAVSRGVRVWDTATGQAVVGPLIAHFRAVTSLAFSPDGTRLVTGSQDHTLRMWDLRSGAPIGDPLVGHSGEVHSVAFSPDGHRIASGSVDQTVRLWDADAGRSLGQGLSGHRATVYSVMFSADGQRLLSGDGDGVVRVWQTPPTDQWPKLLCQRFTNDFSPTQWSGWVSPDVAYVRLCPGLPLPPG